MDRTLAEIDRLPEASKQSQINEITEFIDSLISHFVLDEGKLVVAHAGMKQEMQGRGSGKVRDFALYGETTGETDEFGLPVRYNWAAEYRGDAIVVYGHRPVVEPEWLNRTINIDTGCVFGGKLTTLRYPERELVSVEAVSFPGNGSKVHADQSHEWHMNTLSQLAAKGDPTIVATPYKLVDVTNSSSEQEAIDWWSELTSRGGEGMVVKPLSFIAKGQRGLTQPAVKCRGREYLRIIYGPEYSAAENLERLRSRGLFRKRSLALREFALGVEALERFVRREPLRRVHECVFGVLALESEPIDPRL